MAQSAVEPHNHADRLATFRKLREQLAPARDPASAFADYVERPGSIGRRIAGELELAPASTHVVVGGVGSGKTTELLAVASQLRTLADTVPVFLDVSAHHDLAKLKSGVATLLFGLELADWIHASDLDTEAREAIRKPRKALRDRANGYWASVWEQEDEPEDDETIRVPGFLEHPDPVHPAVSASEENIGELLATLRIAGKRVVALLDGLDRLSDVARFEEIVRNDIKALAAMGVGVVLVAPLRALYGIDRAVLDLFERTHYQAWIDVERDEQGREHLTSLLSRRVPPQMIEVDSVHQLVSASGGVARDLLALAQTACVESYLHGDERIGLRSVNAATEVFGRKHMQGLRPDEIEILERVRARGQFVHTSEEDLALLMTRRVLEYRDQREQPRYVVHPTIAPFLKEPNPF